MFWEGVVLGITLLTASIGLYGVVPRPVRIVIGLLGTVLLLGALTLL